MEINKTPPFKEKRSAESIHHFHCAKCQKWWSIGDAPKKKEAWFCPWCGEKGLYPFSKSKK